jgi:DNA-binding transcriptional regulator LsrR (DeoR family)
MDVPMTHGRKTEDFESKLLRSLVKHLYFELGKLEREVASELGISRRMVNYYKNRQKQ